MWKIIAILCVLNTGELVCTTHYETIHRTFPKQHVCEEEARAKFDTMITSFTTWNVPFTTLEVGCELHKG